MRTSVRLLSLLAALAFLVAACGSSTYQSPAPSTGAPPDASLSNDGRAAPALSGAALVGEGTIDLESMAGKPTVVVFWLHTCPHCQVFVPGLQAAWPEVADTANVLTVGLPHPDPNAQAAPGFETPEAFVETTGLTLPTILGSWEAASADWGFDAVPAVFVLDADQDITEVLIGPEPAEVIAAVRAAG